jgi:C-terminal processing protease CtpA/Prc
MRMQVLDPAEKSRLGLPASALAIKVVDLAPDFARDRNTSARTAGIQKNDVIVEVDGLRAAMTESEFIAYLIQKKGKGQKVGLSYARGGQVHKVQLDLP